VQQRVRDTVVNEAAPPPTYYFHDQLTGLPAGAPYVAALEPLAEAQRGHLVLCAVDLD
jgi:hypothetical protein